MFRHLHLLCCFMLISASAGSQIIAVGDNGDFPNLEALDGLVSAGDTVQLEAQIFSDGTQFLVDWIGTEASPIVILGAIDHQSIFRGGTEAIHLIDCNYVVIDGIRVEQQTGNGINIDDGGDYSTPSTHITIRNCLFRDMAGAGNNDLLKMSGVDSFFIQECQFLNGGSGGSGVDFVGCHWGVVEDCFFEDPGVTGIQCKGGTQFIRMQRNTFKNVSQRALNLGGSTGLEFFRPPLPDPIVDAFEAADLEVFSNVFIGSRAPVAYVGSVRVKVYNNTFYNPDNWVIRILQENTATGFLVCGDNEFRNNIVYLPGDLTEVNIGPNTASETFGFSNNLWFNASSDSWTPNLPVPDIDQIIDDPLFEDPVNENFIIPSNSPAVGAGLTVETPVTDFNNWPFLSPPSIGAFEGGEPSSQADLESKNIHVQLFPNPAMHSIWVDGERNQSRLVFLNTLGQVLKRIDNISLPVRVDVSDFPAGVISVLLVDLSSKRAHARRFIKR
ncbi:MAG: right-handed parallel beta-helix repeat-containing protein [Bacteroidota bacterium]